MQAVAAQVGVGVLRFAAKTVGLQEAVAGTNFEEDGGTTTLAAGAHTQGADAAAG